jgi:hypothetical protein
VKTLFDHVNAIFVDKSIDYLENLEESERKTYSQYMVNRVLSMNPAYIEIVNEFQSFYEYTNNRDSYLFYSQLLPKGKQFNKYIKSSKKSNFDPWIIGCIAKYYDVSYEESKYYFDLLMLTDEGKNNLKEILEFYGTDSKIIKKAKL